MRVSVKVQPRSRRVGVIGPMEAEGGVCLRIGVSEPAESGRANRAARVVLAEAAGVAVSAVAVVSGGTGRRKVLHAAGDPARIIARLEGLWALG